MLTFVEHSENGHFEKGFILEEIKIEGRKWSLPNDAISSR
jgi:hypothetical protein